MSNISKKDTKGAVKMEDAENQLKKCSIEGAKSNISKKDTKGAVKKEDAENQLKKCSIEEKKPKNLALSDLDKTKRTPKCDVAEKNPEPEIVYEGPSAGSARSDSPEVVEIGAYKVTRSFNFKAPDTKILKRLEIHKHVNFMKDFDPQKSQREARKLEKLPLPPAKDAKSKRRNRNRKYDEKGIYIETGEDLCDCLIDDCPGCHFPCPKCRSCKCGHICRCNRTWCSEEIEIEGTGEIIRRKH